MCYGNYLFKIFVFLLFSLQAKPQSNRCGNDSTEIVWSPNGLVWNDFTKNIKREKFKTAESVTRIDFCFSLRNDTVFFKTLTYFSKVKSWINDTTLNTAHLRHEQTHFDITEYYRRRFWEEVKSSCENETDILTAYKRIIFECDRFQEQYDLQTNHSMNKVMQEKWELIVQDLLCSVAYKTEEIHVMKPICKICWSL